MNLAIAEADAAAQLFTALESTGGESAEVSSTNELILDDETNGSDESKLEALLMQAADSAFAQQMLEEQERGEAGRNTQAGRWEEAEQCRKCGEFIFYRRRSFEYNGIHYLFCMTAINFGIFERRHHCRKCHGSFCDSHSTRRVILRDNCEVFPPAGSTDNSVVATSISSNIKTDRWSMAAMTVAMQQEILVSSGTFRTLFSLMRHV